VKDKAKWLKFRLDDLCDVQIGRTPRRDTPRFWNGDHPWATIRDLLQETVVNTKERISDIAVEDCMGDPVPEGTLLFSFKLTIGRTAVAGCSLFTNEAIAALPIRDPSRISRNYLQYALMAQTYVGGANNAVLGKLLNKSKVCGIQIPVPRSMEEQEHIVRILDNADELRKLRAEADKRTTDLIPAIFHEMFGDPETNPKGWATDLLGNLVETLSGGTPPKERDEFWGGDIPWVSPKDMKPKIIRDSKDHISQIALQKTTLKIIPKNSVLIVVRGMILAHTVPIRVNEDPVTINQDMKALLPDSRIQPHFLRWMLQGLHNEILSEVSTASHGTKKLDTARLLSQNIFLPPPMLQQDFLNRVEKLEELEGYQAKVQHRLDDLFRSLLHRAFAGEL